MSLSITSQPVSQLVALGSATSFSVVATHTDPTAVIYYQWNKYLTPIQGSVSASLSFPAVTCDPTGNDCDIYNCTIRNSIDDTVLVTNWVALACSILDNVELNMKIRILGITKATGYNFDWKVVNEPDEAAVPGYPRVVIESPAETNTDSPNTPNCQAYTNYVLFTMYAKGDQAWSNCSNFTIRSLLRMIMDDLKRCFGPKPDARGIVMGDSVNDSCDMILYRSHQILNQDQNDIQRPSKIKIQWLVKYCQDRAEPLQRASA